MALIEPMPVMMRCGVLYQRPLCLLSTNSKVSLLRHTRNPEPTGYACAGYATSSSSNKASNSARRQVTVVNDDGAVRWQDLSMGEKAARTTQQTFNAGLLIAGAVGTSLVAYFLYKEVFATDSKTVQFNRAVDTIRADATAVDMLGDKKKILAYGEPTSNKWARARPIASTLYKDTTGLEHLKMHFYVEGSSQKGEVNAHLVRSPGGKEYEYQYLALDVPGKARHYVVNSATAKENKAPGFRFLGVQWR